MCSSRPILSSRFRRVFRRTRGAALIVVLAMLVLITVMVVAFLSSITSEYGAAKLDSDLEATRQLGDAAVQIVMGQIRAGTTKADTAWASQPGMIRTYDSSGGLSQVYALYSGQNMIRSVSGTFNPSEDLPGSTWATDRAQWVDLNFPVETDGTNAASSKKLVFPIIDPRAATVVSGGNPLVEGFAFDETVMAGAKQPTAVDDMAARLPMPVRWVYVLSDGQLATPTGGSGDQATFGGPGPVPSLSNPIVGRIAFWTDDETCKLNVNTACGGVPWDTPIGNSGLEMLFARYQPAKNEFSRYPGHPATVSLVPVFWSFLGMTSPTDMLMPAYTPNFNTTLPMVSGPTLSMAGEAFRDKLFPLIPRNTFGGSSMATMTTANVMNGSSAIAAVDADRLFGSADEIIHGPNESNAARNANPLGLTSEDSERLKFFLTAQSRAPEVNLFNQPKICLWPLPDASRKSVANGNAIAGDTRSALDRLIAFCGTLAYDNGTKRREYGFTRYDATSPTNDVNATDAYGTTNNRILYSYLESMMSRPLPGFGGSFSGRYGAGGSSQILTGVYDFIRSQINLTDTSHSTNNPSDANNLDGRFVSRYAYAANFTGSLSDSGLSGNAGQVIPARMPNGTQGSGRLPVISQVALRFIATAANQPPGAPLHPRTPAGNYPTIDMDTDSVAAVFDASRPTKFHTHPGLRFLTLPATPGGSDYVVQNPRYRGPALLDFQTEVEPTLMIGFSLPAGGIPGYRAPFRVRVRGLQNLSSNGSPLFPSYDSQLVTISPGVTQFNLGPSNFPMRSFLGTPLVVGPGADSGRTFPFGGGSIEIDVVHPTDNALVLQTYKLSFPVAAFPTPLLPNPTQHDSRSDTTHSFWNPEISPAFPPTRAIDLPPSSLLTSSTTSVLSTTPNHPAGVSGYAGGKCRLSGGTSTTFANLILPEWPVPQKSDLSDADYRGKLSSDTVRSLEVAYGDARLLTQFQTIPADLFLPHRFYFDTKMRAAHSFRNHQHETLFEHMHGATMQYLTASAATAAAALPTYGGAWNKTAPNPGNLWDVASGEDVKRLTYNRWTKADNSVISARWPFTASSCEFDADKFAAYKASSASLSALREFSELWQRGGDFSSGIPGIMDGSMLGKVDEGNNRIINRGLYPYFNELAYTAITPVGPNLFSPNRQVPSPVVLGSIPSGYSTGFNPASPSLSSITPWRTLLFSPNPAGVNHEALSEVTTGGALVQKGKAPDFTLLDFFWMPIVEPYAVSEPLSTAGKVNMNAQLAPFTYINRDTALRGVLRSALLTAVPDKWINNKNTTGSGSGVIPDMGGNSASINYANFRYPINAGETLKQFRERFKAGDIFRSASEICSLWLYPDKRSSTDAAGPTWTADNAAIKNWWYGNPGTESKSVTGDNLREKPYATLYPLLTTKSNTFTVHFKVQALKKSIGGSANVWQENRDRVTSEYQGSQTIERYVDPADTKLVDFATRTAANDPNTGDFYRFRILSNKRFAP